MSEAAFNFQTLTPEVIIDALWKTGLRVESGLTALNSYENRVYQFSDETTARYVAKFYRPQRWTEQQIEEEHQFSIELAEEGVSVAAPLMLEGKRLHQYRGFCFSIFPSFGGRLYENDNYSHMASAGSVLGQIHRIGGGKLFKHRPTVGLQEFISEPVRILETSPLVPAGLRGRLLKSLTVLNNTLRSCWHDNWLPRRLHGDCHPGNILWPDAAWLADFDDARNGPAVQDLWMLISGDRHEQRVQWDILLEAYSEHSQFAAHELSLIEPLRTLRMVYYLAWVARRWQDPAFPGSFPWMKDEDYWRKQISIFNEQEKLLQAPPIQLLTMF